MKRLQLTGVARTSVSSSASKRFKAAPESEAHSRIRLAAPGYKDFALISHLREAHGITEIMPERAPIAHALFTRHDLALASPRTACPSSRHPRQRKRFR
jgi:hypothetical protein